MNIIFKPNFFRDFIRMATYNIMFGLLGYISALMIIGSYQLIMTYILMNKQHRYISLIILLLLSSIWYAYLHIFISVEFGNSLQKTTPGLFYVSIYSGFLISYITNHIFPI